MRRYHLDDLQVHYDLKRTQMPASCMGGWNYHKVGLFIGTASDPSMLSERSRHVAALVAVWDRIHFGSTDKSEGPQLLVHVRERQRELRKALNRFRNNPRLRYRKLSSGRLRAMLVPGAELAEIVTRRTAWKGKLYTASFLTQDLGEFARKRDARAAIQREFELFVGEVSNG